MPVAHQDHRRITIPGFTAEASLGQTTRRIRSPSRWRTGRGQGVDAQLTGARFGTHVGRLSTIGDYWSCKDGCGAAHRSCLAGCEGTWESPKGSTHCILCDNDYRACVRGCESDIA